MAAARRSRPLWYELWWACSRGDLRFVSECIAEERDRGQNVIWRCLMETAIINNNMDIVYCIRDSGRGSVDTQLYYSCLLGDLEFVSQRIAGDRDRRLNVGWGRLLKTAYDKGHMDIVRCIRDSGRGSVDTQLYYSCLLGDLEFVSKCIAEDRDRGQNVNWKKLVKEAYDNNNKHHAQKGFMKRPDRYRHMDIVRCIRDSGRVPVDTELYYSCLLGDLEFVSQCIAEDRDRGHNVHWNLKMDTAYDNKYMDIVRCIRDSGRGFVENQLYYSCLLGDLEFVSQCIAEDRDRGQNVDWNLMMNTAYDQNLTISKIIVESGKCTLADLEYERDITKIIFVINHTKEMNKEIRPGLNTLHVATIRCIRQRFGLKNSDANSKINIINLVMEKGAKVNGKGFMGRTALHFLCHGENTDVDDIINCKTKHNKAKQQPTKKSNLNKGGKLCDDIMVMCNVINKGGDVNATDDNGHTPLHLLCLSTADVGICNLLLEKGANINKRDNVGRTPLAVAAQHGNTKFISFLLKKGCDKNMGTFIGETPLYLSAIANRLDSAEILSANGVNVNQADDYSVTPLAAACKNNRHQIVGLLLQHGADPGLADMEERTPLHHAAMYGSVESYLQLNTTTIDINGQDITGSTALHLANNLQIINALLDDKCNVHIANNLGNTALHNAVSVHNEKNISTGNEDIVVILLQKESDIDHKNNYGHTPIMLSANTLDFAMMKFLYDNKANLELVNNMQRGLIHIVVKRYSNICLQRATKYRKCQDIIKWLIENGLSINASDVNKQTPLHLAAQQGELELVSLLVECGSDVNARDKFKHTPLMNALELPEVFQYLWEKCLPAMTDDDFCKLQRLGYWLDISDDIKAQITQHAVSKIELSTMPQNVSKLELRYGNSLEKWLRTEEEKLPPFMANWLPSLQPLTYIEHPDINNVMWEFLNDIQDGVKKVDPFVAYVITRCGSVDEKTKAFAQDENDCSCVLQNIRFEMFETPREANHPVWKAFVHLICKDEYFDHLKRVLDGKKRLSQGKLCHHFGKAIGKVLANPAFWAKYPQLQRISAKDISAGDRRICTMHIIWSDEICPWLKIDIDLAPVIDLSKWKPSWCNKHRLLGEIESIALPKWKMTPNVSMDLMEIGVHSWAPLFHKMPEEMRQGYRLSKVVRGSAVCPQIQQLPSQTFVPEAQFLDLPQTDLFTSGLEEWSNAAEFMNTYLLKQVIMHEYTAWYDQKMEGLDPPVHTDVYWARRIYEVLEAAFKCRELYSWFIPTYNLLNDDKFVQFQDIAVLYARLCRRLLTEEAADHFRKAYLGGSHD